MLILTRKPKQKLIIGDEEVVITVLGVKGNQVRIGVEAAKGISVHREEIFDRMKNAGEKVKSFAKEVFHGRKSA